MGDVDEPFGSKLLLYIHFKYNFIREIIYARTSDKQGCHSTDDEIKFM